MYAADYNLNSKYYFKGVLKFPITQSQNGSIMDYIINAGNLLQIGWFKQVYELQLCKWNSVHFPEPCKHWNRICSMEDKSVLTAEYKTIELTLQPAKHRLNDKPLGTNKINIILIFH